MDPKVKYSHYERLIGTARELLPALDRIVPAAAVVAKEQMLSTSEREQLEADFEIVKTRKEALAVLQDGLAKTATTEALFVSSAIGGGLNTLLYRSYIFADTWKSDPEFAIEIAGGIKRQFLNPYLRFFHDAQAMMKNTFIPTGVNFMMGGKDVQDAVDYYKIAPFPADVVQVSEVVYGLVFSALLFSGGERKFSLDFTSRIEGEEVDKDKKDKQGLIEIENAGGIFAAYLSGMIGKPEMQPTFLAPAFDAGLSVHGTTIRVPFQIARKV